MHPTEAPDAALIAVVMGIPETAAHAALARFGNLPALLAAEPAELATYVPGIGERSAPRLQAARALADRARVRAAARTVRSPEDVAGVFRERMRHLQTEELHAAYLNRRHKIVNVRRLAIGSDSLCVGDPRQVYRPAVSMGAAAVIIAHNHPSGDPTPSGMDREVTRRVARAGQILGVQLLDHIVVGNPGWSSLAEAGCIPGGRTPTAVATGA